MIVAIDTETYEKNEHGELVPKLNCQNFTLGCIKTEKGTTTIHKTKQSMRKQLNKIIQKNKDNQKNTYIYAHNMQYDYYTIYNDLLPMEETQNIRWNPLLAIHQKRGYFLDTKSFYRQTLQQLGQLVNTPKQEMPKKIRNTIELNQYIETDTKIVLKAMKHLKETLQTLGFTPKKMITAGQIAMTSFRTYTRKNNQWYPLAEKKIKKDKTILTGNIIKTKHEKQIRKAYKAARNEAFQTGTHQNTTYIDANGLYPYILMNMKIPDLNTETPHIKYTSTETFEKIHKNKLGIINCTIKTPIDKLPYLPIRFGKYQLYPRGKTLTGTWTIPEIKKALQLNHELHNINWMITYERNLKTNPFNQYLTQLWIKRQNTQGTLQNTIKLLMNNLYGKFAQKTENKEQKLITRSQINQYLKEGWEILHDIDNKYIIQKENTTNPYTPTFVNPIISILTASQARNYMYKNLTKIPEEDLLYTDTDSIIFKGNHLKKYQISKHIGEFKIVAQNEECKILGEKRYYIGSDTKLSGVNPKNYTKKDLKNENKVTQKKMISYKQAIKKSNMNLIGTFKNTTQTIKTSAKNQIPLPETIIETTQKRV